MSEWRYLASRLNGDGTETIIVPELPLSGVSLTRVKNAPTEMSGQVTPEYGFMKDDQGVTFLDRWSTAIYAEEDGIIKGGGILVDDGIDPESGSLDLTIMGFSGYPNGMPYTEGDTWPSNPYPKDGIEPMSAFREIWRHLQAQERGNLGVTIDTMNTGRKIGKRVAQGEFDTINGPLSFEYEPFLLRWFETFDLADPIQRLVEGTPIDFIEDLSWMPDRQSVRKHIRFGYPRLGMRRQDQRFVMGENIQFSPIASIDEEYADVILGLGAGEGSAMKKATAYRSDEHRIRRARAVEFKDAKTDAAVATAARAMLRSTIGADEVTSIEVLQGHQGELASVEPGDEVRLVGDTPHRDVDMWVRVSSKTLLPDDNGLRFDVTRADRLAA